MDFIKKFVNAVDYLQKKNSHILFIITLFYLCNRNYTGESNTLEAFFIRKYYNAFLKDCPGLSYKFDIIYEKLQEAFECRKSLTKISNQELQNKVDAIYKSDYDHTLDFLPYEIEYLYRFHKPEVPFLKQKLYFIICNFDALYQFATDHADLLDLMNIRNKLSRIYRNSDCKFDPFDPLSFVECPRMGFVISIFLNLQNLKAFANSLVIEGPIYNLNDFDFIRKHKWISDKKLTIYALRHDYINHDAQTLEEIGQSYGVTKERIRQLSVGVQKHLIDSFNHTLNQNKNLFIEIYYDCCSIHKYPYFTLEEFYQKISRIGLGNLETLAILSLFEDGSESNIVYDKTLKIFYDKRIFKYEDIKKKFLKDNNPSFSKEEKNNFTDIIDQKIISETYQFKKGKYIKSKLTKRAVYYYLVRKYFPQGIHVAQLYFTDDTKALIKYIKHDYEFYGDDNPRGLYAILKDINLAVMDYGFMVPIENCKHLDEETANLIFDYARESDFALSFDQLYEQFKSQLEPFGIKNRYALKTFLDIAFKDDKNYSSDRDYVYANHDKTPIKTAICEYIKQQKNTFTVQEINEVFPNEKEYLIYSCIDLIPNVLGFEMGNYKYYPEITISSEIFKEIKEAINLLYKRNNKNLITITTLYRYLVNEHNDLYLKLNEFNNEYRLFSLLAYVLYDEFCFRRPIIAKSEADYVTVHDLIKSYAESLDIVTRDIIIAYTSKYDLGQPKNLLNLFIELSSSHVQYKKDALIKKEFLKLDDGTLSNVRIEIQKTLIKNKMIDTRLFNDYTIFTKIPKFSWNKYLLIGLIRSYFNDVFKIDYTTGAFDTTDFIISNKTI